MQVNGIDAGKSREIVSLYQDDPVRFMVDVLDVRRDLVWAKMDEIACGVRDNKFTAVKAGHGVSKSFTASRIALWFLYSFYPSTVITTAPSHTQVEEILWREIRSCHANAKVAWGGNVTKTKIDLAEKWFAYGFATKSDTVTQEATRFQGYHNDNVLIILKPRRLLRHRIALRRKPISKPLLRQIYLRLSHVTT